MPSADLLLRDFHHRVASLRHAGDDRGALDVLSRVLKRDPGSVEARCSIAEILAHHGASDHAKFVLRHAEKILEQQTADADSSAQARRFLAYARIRSLQGKKESAISLVIRAIASDIEMKEARDILVALLDQTSGPREFDRAIQCVSRAGVDPSWLIAHRCATLIRQGKFEEARRRLTKAPASRTNASIRRIEAVLLARTGRGGESAKILQDLRQREPGDTAVSLELASVFLRQGKIERAWKVLKSVLDRLPSVSRSEIEDLKIRFRIQIFLCDYISAARVGERIISRTRQFQDFEVLRRPFLSEFLSIGEGPEEWAALVRSRLARYIANHPNSPWGYYYKILTSARSNGTRLADMPEPRFEIAKLMTFTVREYGWMQYEAGRTCLNIDDLKGALRRFKIAIRFFGRQHWKAQCSLGETLLCLGKKKEGLAAFGKAAAWTKRDPRAHGEFQAWKGEVELWLGRYSEALHALDEGIRSGAQFAFGWKGGALVKLGRYREAIACLDHALRVVPGDVETRIWRAEACYRSGDFRRCLRDLDGFESNSIYAHAIAGLAAAAASDYSRMRREYEQIPAATIHAVSRRLGIGGVASEKKAIRIFKGILSFSKGVRIGNYTQLLWTRRACG